MSADHAAQRKFRMAPTTTFGSLLLQTAVILLLLQAKQSQAETGSRPIKLRDPEGVITSPSYPKDDPGQDVSWIIDGSFEEWLRVQFVLDYANITDNTPCESSYLRIQDKAANGKILATYCGEYALQNLPPVESSGTVMYITFHSNSSFTNQGARFQARYKLVSTTIDVDLKTSEAIVSTPNYPGRYPSNAYREWNIEASSTYEFGISLDFWKFDVKSKDGCKEDYVEIFEGNSFLELSSVGKYCNNRGAPGSIFSLKSKVRVVFSSIIQSSRGTGFEVKLKRKSLLVRIMIPVLCCVLLITGVIAILCFIRRRNTRRRRLSLSAAQGLVQNDEQETEPEDISAQVDSDSLVESQQA